MAGLTIFHTSDMHNKLTAEWAERLHELKAASPGSLMLDSGDAIWAGNVFWRLGGEPVLDLMNGVPYDALCMGNREFHFLGIACNSKTSRAEFPVLSANLRRAGGWGPGAGDQAAPSPDRRGPRRGVPSPSPLAGEGRGEGEKPRVSDTIPNSTALRYATFDRDGLRVTVFGLSVPCITERMLVSKVSEFYFDQPISAAAEIVPALRSKCDLLIALTHIGIKADRELAEKVSGIDLILGGHTHVITDERVGDTRILHHGFYVHYAGKVIVEVDSGRIDVTNELIPVGKA